jgi:hypothetical protein
MRTRRILLILAASLTLIAAGSSGVALAHSGGGGAHGGGGHAGGFHGGAGMHGGGFHGGGWRGGGYYGGWYGRGYGRGWYGWGLGYGLLFATLPWYYDTYWWDGVPYYYADDVYYQWNGDAGQYESVPPPVGLENEVQTQAPVMHELFVYPKGGQTNEQLAHDREECRLWAITQSGYDPKTALPPPAKDAAGSPVKTEAESLAAKGSEYLRAEGACLLGKNYSVE